MTTQKDLKRLVRARMRKTGEAYTAARLQLLKKNASPSTRDSRSASRDYASLAGMSDERMTKHTGRSWAEWLAVLDAAGAVEKPHREIARHVSSLGTPSWWTQMVTVGYERIRGLREKGQRRDGAYDVSKSRTFNVPIDALFNAFANARTRRRWLDAAMTVRTTVAPKRMRTRWDDGTPVTFDFVPKGQAKSTVVVTHQKLPNRSAAEAMKKAWTDHLDRLGEALGR